MPTTYAPVSYTHLDVYKRQFLNYLNKEKYDISKLKLPPYILIALKLLDAIRLACDRLHEIGRAHV